MLLFDESDSRLGSVIAHPPHWTQATWPEAQPLGKAQLEDLALLKILTLFDFNAGIAASEPSDIREELLAMNPLLMAEGTSGRQD